MALEAKGRKFCKVTHVENGRVLTRRVYTLTVQGADGRVYRLEGDLLPDSIVIHSGVPYGGAHLGEVLLNPSDAMATRISSSKSWISKREAIYFVLGYFVLNVVRFLAQEAAIALT